MNFDLKKIDSHILAVGAITSCLAGFFWSLPIFLGALMGASLAYVNWIGFRFLVSRLLDGGNRARFGILLGLKFVAVLALVSIVLMTLPVNLVAFIIGISSLFFGIVTRTCGQALYPNGTALKEDL